MRRLLAPLRMIADAALPPRCPGCGVVVPDDSRFCAGCWMSLRFLGPPHCAACGTPFVFDRGDGALCGTCIATPPRHAGVRAAVAYGATARAVALRLKYGGRIHLARLMAGHMQRLLPENADLLVPVPLHRWRLWSRGFNQAALIAQAVGRAAGKPVDVTALIRTRSTPPLKGLGRRERAKAVRGAFAVRPSDRERLHGRRIVLVDDVYTSGATADACTRALLAAGATSVTILCWARVIEDGPDD